LPEKSSVVVVVVVGAAETVGKEGEEDPSKTTKMAQRYSCFQISATCPGPKGAEEARAHPSSSHSARLVGQAKQGRATAVVGRGKRGVMPANNKPRPHTFVWVSLWISTKREGGK